MHLVYTWLCLCWCEHVTALAQPRTLWITFLWVLHVLGVHAAPPGRTLEVQHIDIICTWTVAKLSALAGDAKRNPPILQHTLRRMAL
jgi:hypothetical protein